MKIERLINILVPLLSQNSILTKEIAEVYQVSVRTIYRDIKTLGLAGFPIYSKERK
ncbi:HTH domain-containing protein [Vagococcus silagei]|uniref:HTH domain-containing protein n=1 Tax=Vagococcus silagei TaxID=2508885 RepID=A0A4S3B3H2_9ENTE|nr:HTH domain-containing protein [Vagococcus silagei]